MRGWWAPRISMYPSDDMKPVSPCGLWCEDCESYSTKCAGCSSQKGKLFWGECSIYKCVSSKGLEHCGLCDELPCDQYLKTFLTYLPKEKHWRVFFQMGDLIYRKKKGTATWIRQKKASEIPRVKKWYRNHFSDISTFIEYAPRAYPIITPVWFWVQYWGSWSQDPGIRDYKRA